MPRDRRGEDSKGLTPHPVRSRLYLSDTDRHARRKGTLCAALRTLGAEPWNTKFSSKEDPSKASTSSSHQGRLRL
jgi:hypothetical protein